MRLTRRAFVVAGGSLGIAALACELWPAAVRAAAPGAAAAAARLRVGYQIFGWGRYFPSAWWKGARAVGALGFRGIEGEYTIAELYHGREEEFEAGMQQCGVRLAALYSTTDLERSHEQYENVRKNLHAAAFCRRMGARVIVIGGTEARAKTPDLLNAYARAADELGARVFETTGVRLGVHPHVGALIETREDIDRVMDRTDPRHFALAPDTGHLLAAGCDPPEIFRTYGERIVHVHLKDYAAPVPPGVRGAFLPLGRGSIDFPALVRILADARFDGWLNVELDGGRGGDPAQVAREAREYVEERLRLPLTAADESGGGGA